jgi:hypothetical protein
MKLEHLPGLRLGRSVQLRSFAALALALISLAGSAGRTQGATLGDAVDRPELTWTTGGHADWFFQTATTHDGMDAAQCGLLTNAYQNTWIETTVTGRVSVVYWWRLSADPSYYSVAVQTNGSSLWNLSGYGERAWQPAVVSLPGGTNTVRWTYTTPPTDPTNWAGNALWLDQVLVTNITDLAPVFVIEPPATFDLPEYAYAYTNLSALAVGDIPMTYQWQRTGTNLPALWPFYDVSSPSLLIYPRTQEDCGGEFRLVASNQWGMATSSVCTVTVLPSPPYVPPHEPADRVAALGGSFNLWASVWGSPPYFFQWYTNGTAVPGATNQYYGFWPVTAADAGSYHYVVTNLQGAATSRVAQLTVSADPPTIVSGPSPELREVLPGDYASFSVQATGPEWLFFSWRKEGEADELGTWQNLDFYNLDPTNSGLYRVIVDNYNGAVTSRVSVLAVAPVTALAVAVDALQLSVTNHYGWWNLWTPDVHATNTHDGLCAARSPDLGDWDSASFSTTVAGPTNLSFWWRISAGAQAFLELAVDGFTSNSISGETAWQQQVLALPVGDHLLTWTFRKEDAGYVGQNAAWVDQLVVGGTGDPGTNGSHALVAHYAFDNSSFLGEDTSGHGHDILAGSSWGPEHEFDADAIAGGGAILFYGYSSLAPPTNVLASLADSFTVTAWLKTTQAYGEDYYDGPDGIGVVTAFMGYNTDSVIPLALTGNKAAFWTGNPDPPFDDTLHSASDVNTGGYVHLAVTRDQATGEKRLYVNGVLESTSTGSTRSLTNPASLFDLNVGEGYEGLLDDLQFYSGVLSATSIGFLFANPGVVVPDSTNPPPAFTLAEALNATNRTFFTGGAANWFAQSVVTHDSVAAAQSGAIGDNGETWFETEVIGPGTLSFWWKVSSETDFDYLQLWVDASLEAEISGEQDWAHVSLPLGNGQHFLRWAYVKDGSSAEGADAAWVDQVQFAQPATASLNLEILRENADSWGGARFLLFPQLDSVTPDLITQHLVQSPHASFQGAIGGQWSSSSAWMFSLDSLIEECTNGVWTLYINKDDPSEQRYTFRVTISDLTTNVLGLTTIHTPAHGSTNVSPTPGFHWSGPTNLTTLYAYVLAPPGGTSALTNPPSTATNWPSAPTLSSGTNDFQVRYSLRNVAQVAFTMPLDAGLNPLETWNASASLVSNARSRFVVAATSAGVLLSPQLTPGGLSFGFQTLAGHPHAIEARTNLTDGAWLPLTNFSGDGSLWQFTFPTTNPPTRFFRARTD